MAVHQEHRAKRAKQVAQSPPRTLSSISGPTIQPDLSAPQTLRRAVTQPRRMTPGGMQMLQRAYGNRAVTSLLPGSPGRLPIQSKLTVNPAGDAYEREADRVAGQVVRTLDGGQHGIQRQEEELQAKSLVQRQEEDEVVQTQALPGAIQRLSSSGSGTDVAPEAEEDIQGARGTGQSLPGAVREPMERAFGADFSGVRVHADSKADTLNQSLHAKAFTTGQDIFFRQGMYSPSSTDGQELIAHELTHVVQQGGVAGPAVQAAPFNSTHTGDRVADGEMAITAIVEDAPPRPGHAMMDFEWYDRRVGGRTHYASHLRAQKGTNFFQRIGFGKGAKGIVEELKDVDVNAVIEREEENVKTLTGKKKEKAQNRLDGAQGLKNLGLDTVDKFKEMEAVGGKRFVKKQYIVAKGAGDRALQYAKDQVGKDRTFNFLIPERGGRTNCITFVEEALNKAGLDFSLSTYWLSFISPALGMKAGGIIRGRTHPIRNFVLGLFGLRVVDRS